MKTIEEMIEVMADGEVARFEAWNNRLTELEKENTELREKYDKLCKDVAELRHEFLSCSLDDKDELGKLINKLAYEV